MKNLEDGYRMLERLGEHLINKDEDVDLLRSCVVNVDGYEVSINYTKFFINEMYQCCLQIYSYKTITLPYNVVFKIASKCLGDKGLNFELLLTSRFIFNFVVVKSLENEVIELNDYNSEFNGIKFTNINLIEDK